MSAQPASVELTDYLGVIRRRYLIVGLAVLVCVALGAAYSLTRPDTYRSTALIALPAADDRQLPADQAIDVQTELAVIRSELVAARAAEAIPGDPDTRALLTHVAAEAPTEARVISLTYTDDEPGPAQRGAQAFADAYLAQKEAEQSASIEERARTFEERVETETEGIEAQQRLRDANEPDSAGYLKAQEEIDRASETLSVLTAALTEIRSEVVDAGSIITPARLPTEARARGLGRTLAAALAAGLLLGLAAALVRDRLDTRVRGTADLARVLGLRTLGSIPQFSETHRQPRRALVTVHAPGGPEDDAFRRLRSSVMLAARSDGATTLGVTSSSAGEGKTTVACNLAVALALGGRRVLLVSADLHRGGVEELFDSPTSAGGEGPPTPLPVAPGLSDLLQGRGGVRDVGHQVGGLVVITRGSPVDNPTDLLGRAATADTLAQLADGFDHVIVDTPPVLAVADVLVLAPLLDAVLLVVSRARTGASVVTEAKGELDLAGARMLGTVLNNDTETTRRGAGAYAYAYALR